MKTFDDFKKELQERAREYAADMSEFYEYGIEWDIGSGSTTNGLRFCEFKFKHAGKYSYMEKIGYVYHAEKDRLIAARLTQKSIKPNKRQPKEPVTLDNYEFKGDTMYIKGIHSKSKKDWFKITGASVLSEPTDVICRGRTFTGDQYDRAKKMVVGGMDFFEAADQVGAA